MTMLELKEVIKHYNGSFELHVPSLKVNKGESLGLVGNNGAGKTTLFNLILDLIPLTGGKISSKNKTVTQSEHWKSYTAAYLDERFLIDFLTPEEYFEFIARINALPESEMTKFYQTYASFFNNEITGKKKYIRELSRGNQKKTGLAGTFLVNPELLLLDEPFPNLDPTAVIQLKSILLGLNHEQGVTLFISSHDLKHVTEVCDRIVVLENGRIVQDIKTDGETLGDLEAYFTAT
jgi:ABC-2 type transport system ATP-binding protein